MEQTYTHCIVWTSVGRMTLVRYIKSKSVGLSEMWKDIESERGGNN